MTTHRVHLAEAPTDVLTWLVDHSETAYSTLHHIAENAAPADADDPIGSTASAIRLLHQGGYIEGVMVDGDIPMYRATAAGRAAVKDARDATRPDVGSAARVGASDRAAGER